MYPTGLCEDAVSAAAQVGGLARGSAGRALADVAPWVGAWSRKLKSRLFNSRSGCVPRLWVQSPDGATRYV